MGRVINRLMNRVIDRTSGRKAGGPTDMRVLTTAEGDIVTLRDSVNGTLNEIYIYGKSVQNGTPTPDSPVAIESFENAEVRTNGGNLFKFPQSISKLSCDVISRTDEEAIFLVTDTGAYFSNLAYSVGVGIDYPNFFAIPISSPCKLYVDSGSQYSDTGYYSFADSKKISIVTDVATGRPFKSYTKTGGINITTDDIARGARYILVRFDFAFAPVGTEVKLRPYVGFSPMSSYEPYKEPSVLPIPYALRGLKAASGGNYTDSEGQQWVSDYVHLWKENGVVKGERVEAVFLFDGNTAPTTVYVSPNYIDFGYGNTNVPIVAGGTAGYKPLACNKLDSRGANDVSRLLVNPDKIDRQSVWAYSSSVTKIRFNPIVENGHWSYGTQEKFDEFVKDLTLLFVRQDPVTTTIPTDQATAMLNALKTFKPTTNVIGSKPCGLSVQYKAQAPGEVELYGSSPLVLPYVSGSALKSLYLKGGEITQDGVPTPDSPKPILIGGKELRVNDAGVAYVDGQDVVVRGKNLLDDSLYKGIVVANDKSFLSMYVHVDIPAGSMIYARIYFTDGSYVSDGYGNMSLYARLYGGTNVIVGNNRVYNVSGAEDKYFIAINNYGAEAFRGKEVLGVMVSFSKLNDSTAYEPYKEPQRIPIPLLIGSDTAEIYPTKQGVKVARWGVLDLKKRNFFVQGKYLIFAVSGIKDNPWGSIPKMKCSSVNVVAMTTLVDDTQAYPCISVQNGYDQIYVNPRIDSLTQQKALEWLDSLGEVLVVYELATPTAETIQPQTAPLIKPTSVLTSYASEMKATYKAVKKQWWEYIVGLDHDIDLTDRNVTLEALVSIISNSNPKSVIVIALPSDAYKKCVSGGGWNGTISAELAKKPLVTLALK